MKHNWTRGMELPICIVCGLSPITAHIWGDDDWKQYIIEECPSYRLPIRVYSPLNQREPPMDLVEDIRQKAKEHEAWLETVWPRRMREERREKMMRLEMEGGRRRMQSGHR